MKARTERKTDGLEYAESTLPFKQLRFSLCKKEAGNMKQGFSLQPIPHPDINQSCVSWIGKTLRETMSEGASGTRGNLFADASINLRCPVSLRYGLQHR